MEQLIRQMEPLWGEWYLEHPLGSGAWGDVWQIRRENERAALKTIYIEMKMASEAQLRFEGIDQNVCVEELIQKMKDESFITIQEESLIQI